jgi:hypothetical protein
MIVLLLRSTNKLARPGIVIPRDYPLDSFAARGAAAGHWSILLSVMANPVEEGLEDIAEESAGDAVGERVVTEQLSLIRMAEAACPPLLNQAAIIRSIGSNGEKPERVACGFSQSHGASGIAGPY